MVSGGRGTYGGASFASIADTLGINALDARSVQLQDLSIGPHIIENPPTPSNMVTVATPAAGGGGGGGGGGGLADVPAFVDLEAVAMCKEGGHLNHRRFAAVKVTYGTAPTLVAEADFSCCAALAARAGARAGPCSAKVGKVQGPRAAKVRKVQSAGGALDFAEQSPGALRWMERCTVLLFRSQRWVCTGATNPDEAVMCTLRAAADIRDIYPFFPNPVCVVQNIVASANLFPLLQPGAESVAAQLSPEGASRLSAAAMLAGGARAPREAAAALPQCAARSGLLPGSGPLAGAGAARALPLKELSASFGLHANYKPELFPGAIIRLNGVCFLVFDSGACVITGAKCPRAMARAYTDFLWTVSVHLLEIARAERHAHLRQVVPRWLRALVAAQAQRGGAAALRRPPVHPIVY
jgi:TATA-box binding protein (TBP) (component of TFIID and TFIIIB)